MCEGEFCLGCRESQATTAPIWAVARRMKCTDWPGLRSNPTQIQEGRQPLTLHSERKTLGPISKMGRALCWAAKAMVSHSQNEVFGGTLWELHGHPSLSSPRTLPCNTVFKGDTHGEQLPQCVLAVTSGQSAKGLGSLLWGTVA